MAIRLPSDFTGYVYWVGYVREGTLRGAPTVDVILSDRPISERTQSDMTLRSIKVDVGDAGPLYIGSHWLGGQPRFMGILDVHTAEVDAVADRIGIVKAGEGLDGSAPILDVAHYKLPRSLNNTRLLIFKGLPAVPTVVIPAWEIARYFYSSNPSFSRSIYDGTVLCDDGRSLHHDAMMRFNGVRFSNRRLTSPKSSPGGYAWTHAQAITLHAAASVKVEGEHGIVAFPPTKARLVMMLSGITMPEIDAFLGLRIASARERGSQRGPNRSEAQNEIKNVANSVRRESRPEKRRM
jgi:hypothetical protein